MVLVMEGSQRGAGKLEKWTLKMNCDEISRKTSPALSSPIKKILTDWDKGQSIIQVLQTALLFVTAPRLSKWPGIVGLGGRARSKSGNCGGVGKGYYQIGQIITKRIRAEKRGPKDQKVTDMPSKARKAKGSEKAGLKRKKEKRGARPKNIPMPVILAPNAIRRHRESIRGPTRKKADPKTGTSASRR